MLLLAVHSLQEPSAKVPFAMVTLLDTVKKNQLPPELRCRQIFPTNGTKSTSLWDAANKLVLQEWLDEFLDADCNSEVFEVQEEFAHGISAELTRARATEKVTTQTRATAQAVQERTQKAAADVSQRVGDLDSRLRVSESAAAALKSARESQVAKKTSEVFSGVGRQAQNTYKQALEDKRVQAFNANVSASWTRLSSTVGGFVKGQQATASDSPSAQTQIQSTTTAAPPDTFKNDTQQNGAKNAQTTAPAARGSQLEDAFTIDDVEEEEEAAENRK